MRRVASASSRIGPGDIVVVVPVKDERKYLSAFLRHYRALGASRFAIVDDGSTDGTVEYLRDQPDVDLWTSSVRYAQARRSVLWREWLFAHYGLDRWYLNVDIDEFLVYDRCGEKPVTELAAHLASRGLFRLPSPMLDLYPAQPSAAVFDGDGMPWEVADRFDGRGYEIERASFGISIKGGARRRRFGLSNQLIKYPLIFWDADCSLSAGIHKPRPFNRNFGPVAGVLLHFKFFSDTEAKAQAAMSDGQYYSGAAEYRVVAEAFAGEPDLRLQDDAVSVRYEGPGQLAELGFMARIW
jgi:glycosyltransferase involved in cell wall biosynthesis